MSYKKQILLNVLVLLSVILRAQSATYLTGGRQFAFCDASGISTKQEISYLLPPSWGNSVFSEQLKLIDFVIDDGAICANPSVINGDIAGSEIYDMGKANVLTYQIQGATAITKTNLPKVSNNVIAGKFLQPKEGHLYCFKSRANDIILIEVKLVKMVDDICIIDLRWFTLLDSYVEGLYKKI